MPIPELYIIAGIRAISLISRSVELYQRGEMTQDEIDAEWAKIGLKVDLANEAWEAAKRP